ncbi:unnamed protein product [Rotaria socialis]|uniref:Uncharacterized protein n=1 Tax=Rotaria socialis TaxID=392032 RepID=A0A818AFQ1_9BILA|nr:unnamed protein product [Rotaria socialis]
MVASQHVCFDVARVEVLVSFSTFQPAKKKLTSCANVCWHWNAIITNCTLLSFDIAKDNEVSSRSLTFRFVPNLTGICLLLKRDRYVFEMAQKFIQLQSKTLEKVILDYSPNADHDRGENPQRWDPYDVGKVDLVYELTNLPFITDLIINFPVPVFHKFNDRAYQLLHHLSLDISASSQSYCHTCGHNATLWCNLLQYSGASINWLSEYPINSPKVEIDYSKLKVFPKVDFLSLRTNMFEQDYVKQLFILFPSLTKLSLYAWTDSYEKLIEVCVQYEQLTHLKIRVWTCSGMKYERYELSRLLINDKVINEICTKLQKLTSLDLHGHLDLSNRSLEMMNQNHNFVSIKITDGGIPFHEVDFHGVQNKPSVQFSEDVLVDFAKNHPLLEQLELYVGQVIICKAFTDKFMVNCPRIKVLKLYSSNDIHQKNE